MNINRHVLLQRLSRLFSLDTLRYPIFYTCLATSHKIFVRVTSQLTHSY